MYKYKRKFFLIFLMFFCLNLFGQKDNVNNNSSSTDYNLLTNKDTHYYYDNKESKKRIQSEFNKINISIPNSYTHNTKDIAYYINKNFSTIDQKILATYKWIASNITYDVNESKYKEGVEQSTITNTALKTKKGVCMHFTALYNEILNYMDIENHIIYGYVKINNNVNEQLPHSWNAVYYGDGIWYLFDVTWASGFIQINKGKSTYVKKINLNYLFVDPSEFIKTHMPFDYCWQMLDNPISHKKFYDINDDKDEKFNNLKINYIDSLLVFINASKLKQLNLTLNRTIYAGIYNQLTYNYLNNVKAEIDTYLKNQQINAYNNTINLVNNGNDFINKYVNYFNKQFSPELPEEEVKSLLDSAYNNYKVALFFLENTDNNTIIQNNYSDIINYCKKQIIFVEEQYLFVNQYYSMPKSLRKSLFYIRN